MLLNRLLDYLAIEHQFFFSAAGKWKVLKHQEDEEEVKFFGIDTIDIDNTPMSRYSFAQNVWERP